MAKFIAATMQITMLTTIATPLVLVKYGTFTPKSPTTKEPK